MEDFNYFVGAVWQKEENPANVFNPTDVPIIQKSLNRKLTLIKRDNVKILSRVRVFLG